MTPKCHAKNQKIPSGSGEKLGINRKKDKRTEGISSLNCSDLTHSTKLIPIKKMFSPNKKFLILSPKKQFFKQKKPLLQPGTTQPN